jgi:type III secretion protein W
MQGPAHIERAGQAGVTAPKEAAAGMVQVESEVAFGEQVADAGGNPLAAALRNRSRSMEDRMAEVTADRRQKAEGSHVIPVERARDGAGDFLNRNPNPELEIEELVALAEMLTEGMSAEDVARVVDTIPKFSTDPWLKAEALSYLEEVTPEGPVKQAVHTVAANHRSDPKNDIAIRAAKNMAEKSREYERQGQGKATDLRKLYTEMLDKHLSPIDMFKQLKGYKYENVEPPAKSLKAVAEYLYAALGEDLRAPGPSIERGRLTTLFTMTRTLQAVVQVFDLFSKRMNLITAEATAKHLTVPPTLAAQPLTEAFMGMVEDKFPSAIKVMQAVGKLGVPDADPAAQSLIVGQFQQAIRQISPKFYPQDKTRQDLINSLNDAADQLENKLDELAGGQK